MTVAPDLKGYVVDIVRATRKPADYGLDVGPLLELGASPRATIALRARRAAHALIQGRDYAVPHDVKSLARDVFRHRVVVSSKPTRKDSRPTTS